MCVGVCVCLCVCKCVLASVCLTVCTCVCVGVYVFAFECVGVNLCICVSSVWVSTLYVCRVSLCVHVLIVVCIFIGSLVYSKCNIWCL